MLSLLLRKGKREESYLVVDIIIIIIIINIMKVHALKFLSLLSIFLNTLQFRSVLISTLFYSAVMTFVQIGTADVILCLRTWMEFCQNFLHLLTDLELIRTTRDVSNKFSRKSAPENVYYCCWHKRDYIQGRTVKPYAILKVNSAVAKSHTIFDLAYLLVHFAHLTYFRFQGLFGCPLLFTWNAGLKNHISPTTALGQISYL